MNYKKRENLVSYHEKNLEELGLEQFTHKVVFFQGDASNLKSQFTGYDLILAANLIDRLSDPEKFLTTIHTRLNTNGLLVLTSPYTWLEEFTKKEHWVGGFRKDGEPYSTLEGLQDILCHHFKMLDTPRDIEMETEPEVGAMATFSPPEKKANLPIPCHRITWVHFI